MERDSERRGVGLVVVEEVDDVGLGEDDVLWAAEGDIVGEAGVKCGECAVGCSVEDVDGVGSFGSRQSGCRWACSDEDRQREGCGGVEQTVAGDGEDVVGGGLEGSGGDARDGGGAMDGGESAERGVGACEGFA